jgi:hypothetical protein
MDRVVHRRFEMRITGGRETLDAGGEREFVVANQGPDILFLGADEDDLLGTQVQPGDADGFKDRRTLHSAGTSVVQVEEFTKV